VYGLFEEIDLNAPKKLLTKLCKTVHQKVSQQWQENTPSTLYLEGLATYNGHGRGKNFKKVCSIIFNPLTLFFYFTQSA
jgi:hypothetical protein